MNFIELGLSPSIIKTLNKHNFTKAYPIQGQVIPAVMNGKDVLGIAKTGSGKTASYVLPILMNLYGNPINKNRFVNVLVLVPNLISICLVAELIPTSKAAFSLA